MGLYSVITLIGLKLLNSKKSLYSDITSWYDKESQRTFSDILITVRNIIWKERHFSKSAKNEDFYQLDAKEVDHLIYILSLTG